MHWRKPCANSNIYVAQKISAPHCLDYSTQPKACQADFVAAAEIRFIVLMQRTRICFFQITMI
jgi:hypothetical protein